MLRHGPSLQPPGDFIELQAADSKAQARFRNSAPELDGRKLSFTVLQHAELLP